MHHYANTATCAMLHYTLLGAAPLMLTFLFIYLVSLWRVCYGPHSLAAGCTKSEVAGEWVVGRERALQVRPSPAQPTSAVSLGPSGILSSQANGGGNVSPGVDQESSMPKQGSSCPDTALPEGYVRTFLPFTLSLNVCLSPTPLAGCPSASCLRAVVCFFFPVCALWRCGSLCEGLCGCILQLFNTSLCICCNKLKPHADIRWRVMHRSSPEEPDCWQSN